MNKWQSHASFRVASHDDLWHETTGGKRQPNRNANVTTQWEEKKTEKKTDVATYWNMDQIHEQHINDLERGRLKLLGLWDHLSTTNSLHEMDQTTRPFLHCFSYE